MTLHRLLEFNGLDWERDRHNPIEADVLIVDEVSMVDVPLAWRLFQAVDLRRTCVLLSGDHNQLPPVGPGNLLRDLIDREPIPTVVLDEVMRQAGLLRVNSLALLKGEVCPTVQPDATGQTPWVVAGKFTETTEVLGYLLHLFENVLLKRLKVDPLEEVQVLSPRRDGPLGVEQLNVVIQNFVQRHIWEVEIEPVPPGRRPKLYMHDKVIHTRNNYDKGVMNGELGFVRGIGTVQTEAEGGLGRYEIEVDFEKKRVVYDTSKQEDHELQLAYALTIHKAQGSEFKVAIVVVHKAHAFMHHRNLFYTAVTRAQQTAIVVGDAWGIRHCAEVEEVGRRKTFLSVLPCLEDEEAA